jgi:hypothetical protein
MNHFKKRFAIELGISLLIVTALLWGIFFFKGNVSDYADKIAADRTLLASRTTSVSDLASLRGQYNGEASNYMNILHNIIPSYDELINLNQDLQLLAVQNKVGYGFSFSGETPKSEGGLGSISFSLNIGSDNLKPLTSFIKSLQNFRYLSSIDNLSIKSDEGKLTMNIRGRVFYR